MEKITNSQQKITPFLWFNDNAEEAAKFYTSVFSNSNIETVTRYGKGGPMPEGTVMTVAFQLEGQKFAAINGGPQFQFTPAVSFVINCNSQEEIDHYWNKLTSGNYEQCGWLVDKYGLSWQVVPANIGELMTRNGGKAMPALMKMKKIIIADLENA